MAEPLTAGDIVAIVFSIAVAFLLLPSIMNLATQIVPFFAELISDIYEDWLESWREFVAEIKKIIRGDNDA